MFQTPKEMTEQERQPQLREENTAEPRPLAVQDGFLGKHRLAASIARLHQEIQSIEEEMKELDSEGLSSSVCEELVKSVENSPDGLLPLTKGPAHVAWNRWFEGVHGSGNHKWWMQKRAD